MRLLILYDTVEGQTRKVCRFAADVAIEAGWSVEMLRAGEARDLNPRVFDAVLLAGSIHAGKIQEALIEAGGRMGGAFSTMPSLFIQVSLTAAGGVAEEMAVLDEISRGVFTQMGWTPDRTLQVAGAFRFSEYDFLKSWAMRWVASQRGEEIAPGEDREYTQWAELRADLGEWLAAARRHVDDRRGNAAE